MGACDARAFTQFGYLRRYYFRDIELNAGLGQPEASVRLPAAACIAGEARHPASAIRVYRLCRGEGLAVRRLRRKRLSRISDRLATG